MWWELTIGNSRGRIEDSTLLIKANSMQEALEKHRKNQGNTTLKGSVVECRQIFYVKDEW